MGATFCFPIIRLVFAKEGKVLPPKIASHFLLRSANFDPTGGESLVNKNIFRASPTPSMSLVWKESAITMTAMVLGIREGRQRRLSTVF